MNLIKYPVTKRLMQFLKQLIFPLGYEDWIKSKRCYLEDGFLSLDGFNDYFGFEF
jgi:hypothetical protein